MKTIALLLLSVLVISCSAAPAEKTCEPNFSGAGFSVLVSHIGGNSYRFKICTNSSFQGAIFSVFGAVNEVGLSTINTETKNRAAHIERSSIPGDTFEVVFPVEDLWFAIFEDESVDGKAVFSLKNEMVRGDLSLVPL